MPFIMTKDSSLVFVIWNSAGIECKFTELIGTQIDLFYFNIAFEKTVMNPFLKIEHEKTAIQCVLLPTIACSNVIYYVAVLND